MSSLHTSRTHTSRVRTSSRIRTSRVRLAGAAATALLAAFSLTACGGGTGAHDTGAPARTSTPKSRSTPTPPSSGTAAGHAHASGSGARHTGSGAAEPKTVVPQPAAHAPAAEQPATSTKPVTCEGSNTRTVAAPLTRPLAHMLLTVTNTSSRTCYLYGYPAVRFGEAQSVPPVVEDSKPQAVVTLQPGESGYASVILYAVDSSGTNGRTETSLTVHFQGPSGNGSVGTAAHPPLPAKGVQTDDSLKVSYWQQSMDDAIAW